MAEEVDFTVDQKALATVQGMTIGANFEECKAALAHLILPYKAMIVSEDGISSAKADRAKIRKVANRIDEVRKAVEKAYKEPLAKFTADCKELTEICMEGVTNLDRQVKAYEEAERQKKIDALHAEYDAVADDEAREFCPWERVYNERWANKGYKYEDAVEEIKAAIFYTQSNLESIRSIGGDDVPYLLDVYKQTHDINLVLRKQLELQAAREREEKRKMEAERQATVVVEPKKQQAQAKKPEQVPAPPVVMEEPDDAVEEIGTTVFRVWCTKSQLNALGRFMRENGIQYGRA